MKSLSGTTKRNRSVELKSVTIFLKIDEIDALIAFLAQAKKQFVESKNMPIISKIKDTGAGFKIIDITNFDDIARNSLSIISGEHIHYQDWARENGLTNLDSFSPLLLDLVLHTTLVAHENKDGTFHWENEVEQ
jgi:hypothetical protein